MFINVLTFEWFKHFTKMFCYTYIEWIKNKGLLCSTGNYNFVLSLEKKTTTEHLKLSLKAYIHVDYINILLLKMQQY